MSKPNTPYLRILYNSVDISRDVSLDLESFTYEDKISGESDEIVLILNDATGKWANAWYPKKGDQIQAVIGYPSKTIDCGTFTVDKIQLSGSPDKIEIRGNSTGFNTDIRSEKTVVHEDKTIAQIIGKVADDYGLDIIGDVPDINIKHETQNRKSTLFFVNRLVNMHGYNLTLRNGNNNPTICISSIKEMDKVPPVVVIKKSQMQDYTFNDELDKTFIESEVSYDTLDGVVSVESTVGIRNIPTQDLAPDKKLIRVKAENTTQANTIAELELYTENKKARNGSFTTVGNPLLIAGNNLTIEGLGANSGKWQTKSSSHKITKAGYTTSVNVEMITE